MNEFLKEKIIAIGWPQVGNLSGKTGADIGQLVDENFASSAPRARGHSKAQITKFAVVMQVGEYVLVPNGPSVHLGQIVGEYMYVPDASGYAHQRRVQWLTGETGAARTAVTGAVFNSLKARMTLWSIPVDDCDLASLQNAANRSEISYDSLQSEYLRKLRAGELIGINHSTFEDVVRIVLGQYFPGLRRQSTRNTDGPGDTDLRADILDRLTIRVQVKYYLGTSPLARREVDQLHQSMGNDDDGILVTSGFVGDDARKRADELTQNSSGMRIFIMDGVELVSLLFEGLEKYSAKELLQLGLSLSLRR